MKIPPLRYTSRAGFVLHLAQDKKVLHLGCVGDKVPGPGDVTFHEQLARRAADLWGIDVNGEGIRALQDRLPGLEQKFIEGDATALDQFQQLPRDFGVVIAGDLIEHLTNPGALLDACRTVLGKDGLLVLTTPNALGLLTVLRAWHGRERINRQHTCWFSFSTLHELTARTGWTVQEFLTAYDHEGHSRVSIALGSAFFKLFPQWGGTLIALLRPVSEAKEPASDQVNEVPRTADIYATQERITVVAKSA